MLEILAITGPIFLLIGTGFVAVRSGRSSQSLPLGHTVRRTALPAQAIDAMFEQAGVMQVDVSCGMAIVSGTDLPESVLVRADAAMYADKRGKYGTTSSRG